MAFSNLPECCGILNYLSGNASVGVAYKGVPGWRLESNNMSARVDSMAIPAHARYGGIFWGPRVIYGDTDELSCQLWLLTSRRKLL